MSDGVSLSLTTTQVTHPPVQWEPRFSGATKAILQVALAAISLFVTALLTPIVILHAGIIAGLSVGIGVGTLSFALIHQLMIAGNRRLHFPTQEPVEILSTPSSPRNPIVLPSIPDLLDSEPDSPVAQQQTKTLMAQLRELCIRDLQMEARIDSYVRRQADLGNAAARIIMDNKKNAKDPWHGHRKVVVEGWGLIWREVAKSRAYLHLVKGILTTKGPVADKSMQEATSKIKGRFEENQKTRDSWMDCVRNIERLKIKIANGEDVANAKEHLEEKEADLKELESDLNVTDASIDEAHSACEEYAQEVASPSSSASS